MREERICPILPLPTTTTLARQTPSVARRADADENMALLDPEEAIERIPADTQANQMMLQILVQVLKVELPTPRPPIGDENDKLPCFCSFAKCHWLSATLASARQYKVLRRNYIGYLIRTLGIWWESHHHHWNIFCT